jgi:hypothetical protein
MYTSAEIREWISTLTPIAALLTVVFAFYRARKEFIEKQKAERRVFKSAEIESNVKLMTLFPQIMDIAHSRVGNHVSEKAIEILLSRSGGTSHDVTELIASAVIQLPAGAAAQDAAICAIWKLGREHEVLTEVATQALVSLMDVKPTVVSNYLRTNASGKYELNLP